MAEAKLKPKISETEPQEEVAAYQQFYESVKTKLKQAGDKVHVDTIKSAVDKAGAELKEAGGHSTEAVKHYTQVLKKDIASTAEKLGPKWEKLKDRAHHFFDIWQDRSTVFIGHAASAFGEWLHKKGDSMEHQIYQAGELTYGGTFECTACGARIEIKKANYIQPCPECLKSEFRRI